MAGETVVKDIVGVYSRLFDHRAVLQNESKIFVREFEGKRNDREVTRLEEAKNKIDQINESLPVCVDLSQKLVDVQEQLKEAKQLCHGILVREEQLPNEKREEMLSKMQEESQEFQNELEESEKQIQMRFLERAQQMKEKYGVEDTSAADSPSGITKELV